MKYILNTNYRAFYQLPYCCVPTTLQWIFYKRGLDIMDQEEIGVELGLRIPIKGKYLFKNPNVKFFKKEPKQGFGTQIEKNKYSIEKFFKKRKIPLSFSKLFFFNSEKKLENFIKKNIQEDNDIILRYCKVVTKNNEQKKYGHFSLITAYDDVKKLLTIGDPDPPFFRQEHISNVILTTSKKIDGTQRGFYIVKSA